MADAKMLKKVPVREQDPKVRATNFEEVCLGYNQEEAMEEAQRCLGCKKPKCVEGCPVSINIPGFIEEIKEGKIEEAYKVIGLSSALPAICGRVCPQESQCEGKCIRGVKGEAVSIGKLERFVADYALEHDIKPVGAEVKNGHKVAVIGSGPSGLTCAGDLAKAGYDVTVFEALHELGGVLVYGIPEFRLPKQKVVKKEIEKVKELGVKFETNVVIGKSTTIDQLIEDEGFEAVFIGSGAGLPMFMGIPGENASGVFSANEYLTRSNLMKAFDDSYDTPIAAGKKVAVVGGGNVAMDAARTALRLGAEVHIVYRRSEAELPARAEEVHHAKEEGIIFDLLTNPKEILVDENGHVNGMKVVKMELGEPDASGRRSPVATGETVELPATTVICAVGEGIDASLYDAAGVEHDRRGRLAATSTGVEGVWAAGDCRRGPATVVEAIADAAEVARAIADVDFNKYADCNERAGREDASYERKGSLCRDKHNCIKTRCLGCGSVCEVCCDVCPNRANVAIKVPGLAKHQVVHVDGMCNECGNCAVFCPYQEGRPYKDKLTLFWSEQDMENSENEGFLAVDEDHFKVRVAGTVRTVSVDAVNTGLPEAVRLTIRAVRDNYSYLLKK